MLNQQSSLDLAFHALADPSRRAIVERLARGTASVSELAKPLAMSFPAVMQHLAVLEGAELVASQKIGRVRICRLEATTLDRAESWLSARRADGSAGSIGSAAISKICRRNEATMTLTTDVKAAAPRSLTISRAFAAPPALVFQAWSSAERMKRWFSPEGVDVPEAEIDCRPGGAFVICMRLPDGTEHWCRGAFGEVVPPQNFTFDCEVSAGGKPAFRVRTLVLFAAEGAGTRMTVEQRYEIHDEAFRFAVEGAGEGLAHDIGQARPRGRAPFPASFAAPSRSSASSRRRRRRSFGAFVDPAAKQPLVFGRRRPDDRRADHGCAAGRPASASSAAGRAA